MKISKRLSIIISLMSSTILLIFGIALYLFFSIHQKRDFQKRLKQRLVITENFQLEKDAFSLGEYEKIKSQFLHTLPRETEEVIEIKKGGRPNFKFEYSDKLKNNLLQNETFSFQVGKRQGESKLFLVRGKSYLIIVTAINKDGIQTLSFLLNRIVLLILLGIPLIFTISFLVINKYLLPISKKIQHANMISGSNLSQRLNVVNPNDEIGKMAIAFNKMLDRLEIAFNAKKLFISNASHEIRNPLTAIMGEAEIAISRTRTVEEYQESLNNILSEADTLNATVNNLLQLSKLAGNENNLLFTKLKFDNFLIELKENYNYINANNKIKFQIENGDYYIYGNKNLLKTAIINLFENACKYSSNAIVNIELSIHNSQLKLTIKDQGIGIKEADLEKIFEPFYRGQNTRKIKGTGIGLSLCAKIINIHKGTIDIKSDLGLGTQIYIKLPLILS